jgi:pimeloyl-ACP methyl ester carboxylesterase
VSANKAERAHEIVDVVVGGFGSSAPGYAELLDEMHAATSNQTVFVGMARWSLMACGRNSRYPRVLYRQALHVVRELHRQGIRRVRLYGHSMGGAVVLIVADAFAGSLDIEQVVALNPAGVHVDGVLPLLRRMIRKGKGDIHNLKHHTDTRVRRIIAAGKPGAVKYVCNPVRSLAEGLALSRTRLLATLYPRLSQGSVPIMIVYSDEDMVFEPAPMLAALDSLPDVVAFELKTMPHDVQYHPAETVAALRRHGAL